MTISSTTHVTMRISDRVHLKKKAHPRLLERVIKNGLYLEDIKCNHTLYSYIKQRKTKAGYYSIIYNYYIYIISNDDVFITVVDLPKKYHIIVDKIKCKKEGKKYYDTRRYKEIEDSFDIE